MNPSSSHTHCQVSQADTQTKSWQRVLQPHPEKIELKKFPFPSENKKYANAQSIDRQKSVAMQTSKLLTGKRLNYTVDRRPPCNTGLAKVAVHSSADSNASLWLIIHRDALRINICNKNHCRHITKIKSHQLYQSYEY